MNIHTYLQRTPYYVRSQSCTSPISRRDAPVDASSHAMLHLPPPFTRPYSLLPTRESNACRVPATLAPFHRPRGSPAAAAMLTHSHSQRSPSLSLSSSSLHLHLRRLHFARAPPLLQHTVSASASRLCIRSFYPLPLVFVSASTLSSQVALAWPRCLSSSSSLLFSHLPSSSSSLLSPSRLTALPACIQP